LYLFILLTQNEKKHADCFRWLLPQLQYCPAEFLAQTILS